MHVIPLQSVAFAVSVSVGGTKKQGYWVVESACAFSVVHWSNMSLNPSLFVASCVPFWLQDAQLLNLVSTHTPRPNGSMMSCHSHCPMPQGLRWQVPLLL